MILCGAIKINKCDAFEETIVPCLRHGYGFITIHNLCKNSDYKGHYIEGFITTKGEFLDRKQALDHAKSCGQLSVSTLQLKKERNEDELYTEDLY